MLKGPITVPLAMLKRQLCTIIGGDPFKVCFEDVIFDATYFKVIASYFTIGKSWKDYDEFWN
ncbi:MAG: hypothetical protein ACI84C_001494 [Flavobacteriales bacterium]|jgi:hypothetical protein